VLAGGIFLASILPGNSSTYQFIAAFDANRWVHFLAYASISTIPFATWKSKVNMFLSLLPAVISIALEGLQTHVSGPALCVLNVPADLFGLAAGVLLGMNIRVMRNSASSLRGVSSDPSSSEMYYP
jgi:hypothetical protein